MSVETNKALARKFVEVLNTGNLSQLDGLLATDYIHHDPNFPPELQRGLANYKQGVATFYTAFPVLAGTIEDLVAEGDRVVTRFTWRGTHGGELMGIPATGKQVSFTMIVIQRIANDRIAEGWVNFDAATMMRQIGAG